MAFFRKIFILQLVGLVLTYNFTDCDFQGIKNDYLAIIFLDFHSYMNRTRCSHCNVFVSCNDGPDCLAKIGRLTFQAATGCTALAKAKFVEKTNATFASKCPGYSGMQINNTQTMKKREDTIKKCQEIVSNLMKLWGRFTRL